MLSWCIRSCGEFLRRKYIKSPAVTQVILVIFGMLVSALFSNIFISIIDFGVWEKVVFDLSYVLVTYVVVVGLLVVMENS